MSLAIRHYGSRKGRCGGHPGRSRAPWSLRCESWLPWLNSSWGSRITDQSGGNSANWFPTACRWAGARQPRERRSDPRHRSLRPFGSALGLTVSITAATLRAITHLVPHGLPLATPLKWASANGTNLGGAITRSHHQLSKTEHRWQPHQPMFHASEH